ncbi:MAG: hypothetical protein ACTSX2_00070 [Candidatus Thorarchaeota archaeon]
MTYWADNYDNETAGEPPANWSKDGVLTPDTLLISNTYAHSSPNSMHVAASGVNAYCHHDEASAFTDQLTLYLYIPGTGYVYGALQSTPGNKSNSDIGPFVGFGRNDANIYYNNGSAWIDTGLNVVYDTWEYVKIVPNYATNSFDLTYGSNTVTGLSFYTAQSTARSIQLGVSISGTDKNFWVDDVTIGDSGGWEGVYIGVANPPKINGVSNTTIKKVDGVISA